MRPTPPTRFRANWSMAAPFAITCPWPGRTLMPHGRFPFGRRSGILPPAVTEAMSAAQSISPFFICGQRAVPACEDQEIHRQLTSFHVRLQAEALAQQRLQHRPGFVLLFERSRGLGGDVEPIRVDPVWSIDNLVVGDVPGVADDVAQ